MSTVRTKTYDSYHFGSTSDLTDRQLKQLISYFNMPTNPVDSVLGGRGSVAISQLEGIGSVVVKYYTRGGFIRHLVKQRYLRWGKTRCQIEYELLQKVRNLGLSAPEPIAYAYRGALVYRGWLITKKIEKQQTLAELGHKDQEHARIVMTELINQVSTLIKNNILHVDLHPGNVLVDRNGQVFILDFDRARISRMDKNKLRNHYLSRWRRAVIKHRLPDILCKTFDAGLVKNCEV